MHKSESGHVHLCTSIDEDVSNVLTSLRPAIPHMLKPRLWAATCDINGTRAGKVCACGWCLPGFEANLCLILMMTSKQAADLFLGSSPDKIPFATDRNPLCHCPSEHASGRRGIVPMVGHPRRRLGFPRQAAVESRTHRLHSRRWLRTLPRGSRRQGISAFEAPMLVQSGHKYAHTLTHTLVVETFCCCGERRVARRVLTLCFDEGMHHILLLLPSRACGEIERHLTTRLATGAQTSTYVCGGLR